MQQDTLMLSRGLFQLPIEHDHPIPNKSSGMCRVSRRVQQIRQIANPDRLAVGPALESISQFASISLNE
jgi:hypothetical protein